MAALREFGYVPAIREEMRQVWYSRWFEAMTALAQEMRVGMRSLLRAKGLSATVVVTLALGIGANAAIFSVVRGVLTALLWLAPLDIADPQDWGGNLDRVRALRQSQGADPEVYYYGMLRPTETFARSA